MIKLPWVGRLAFDLVFEERRTLRELVDRLKDQLTDEQAQHTRIVTALQAEIQALHQLMATTGDPVRKDGEAKALARLEGESVERGVLRLAQLYRESGEVVPDEQALHEEAMVLFQQAGFSS